MATAVLAIGVASAAAAEFSDAGSAGGAGTDSGAAIAHLDDGSSIVTGFFDTSATFGSTTITGSGTAAFVAKRDASGAWLWATSVGGSGLSSGYGVATLADGSSVVTGNFNGGAEFGTTSLTSVGSWDVFVAKIDAAGQWLWATRAGGPNAETAPDVSTLADGSSIVTGSFGGAAIFGGTTLTSRGGTDIYVAKVDANGAWVWANRAGAEGTDFFGRDDFSYGVFAFPDGSSVVTGLFRDDSDFGAITLNTVSYSQRPDTFVAKVNASGQWVWAVGGGGVNGSDPGLDIAGLADGSSIVTGYFNRSATYGTTSLTGGSGDEAFVAKVSASGNWVWATSAGTTSPAYGRSVAALTDGSSIVTGYFSGSVAFGTTTLTSVGAYDVFVAQLSSSGTWSWAIRAGGGSPDLALGLTVSPGDGSVAITGRFSGTAPFGLTTLATLDADVFVARVPVMAPAAPSAPTAVAGDGQATVTIVPMAIASYTITASPGGATCRITPPAASCTVTGLADGTAYSFTATATNTIGTSLPSDPSRAVTTTTASAGQGAVAAITASLTASRVAFSPAPGVTLGATRGAVTLAAAARAACRDLVRGANVWVRSTSRVACLRSSLPTALSLRNGLVRAAIPGAYPIKVRIKRANGTQVVRAITVTVR
ncbi:MAG: fibronectin type III domain-containing protein [Gaiellales bacterium]